MPAALADIEYQLDPTVVGVHVRHLFHRVGETSGSCSLRPLFVPLCAERLLALGHVAVVAIGIDEGIRGSGRQQRVLLFHAARGSTSRSR